MSKSKLPQTVEEILPDSANANKGTERGSGLLEDALRRLGAARSIVLDKNNKVISGNHVVDAAVAAGLIRLKVVETNGQELVAVKRTDVDLDSKMGRELAIADNVIALRNIELDGQILADQAKQFDLNLDACGISEGELAELLRDAEAKAEADITLKDVDTRPPPAMSWVLVGIPTTQFGSIAPHVEAIAKISGTIIESTVTSEVPDAEDKPQDGQRISGVQAGAASPLPE